MNSKVKLPSRIELEHALRADENVFSIRAESPNVPFVYFAGTFTSHGLPIHQPWMAELRYLLRRKGYTYPIYLPYSRWKGARESGRKGVPWQNDMLLASEHIVVSLLHLSPREEVFTTATLAMLLARMEYGANFDTGVYIYDPKKNLEKCLQLRNRLAASGLRTHQVMSTLVKTIIHDSRY